MQVDSEIILEAALKLSETERLTLVSRLLETVSEKDQGLSLDDEHLLEELDHRYADRDGSIPWSQLRAEG